MRKLIAISFGCFLYFPASSMGIIYRPFDQAPPSAALPPLRPHTELQQIAQKEAEKKKEEALIERLAILMPKIQHPDSTEQTVPSPSPVTAPSVPSLGMPPLKLQAPGQKSTQQPKRRSSKAHQRCHRSFIQMNFHQAYPQCLSASRKEPDPKTQYYLSLMYERGTGTKKDSRLAQRLLQQATHSGHPEALFKSAQQQLRQHNLSIAEEEQAVEWLTQAAKAGLSTAQLFLAQLYMNNIDPSLPPNSNYQKDPDYQEAQHWLEQAASQGHIIAQYRLGQWLALSQQSSKALAWLSLASEQGYKKAESSRLKLKSSLTATQIQQAQTLLVSLRQSAQPSRTASP